MLIMLIRVLRVISLAILCAGSIGFVWGAMSGVTAAHQAGVPVAAAAAANAPVFVEYSKGVLVLAILLLFVEFLDYVVDRKVDRARKLRYVSSVLCFISAAVLALVIVPRMSELIPDIATKDEAHAAFQSLHNQSRGLVGGIILFAFASIVIPLGFALYELRFEEAEEQTQEKISDQSETKSEEKAEESSKSS
jgi:hypothetical protein